MNPIPLNDRGQFRYADFMAYIPEFLREEPDVVELVQVMSDYINDAYRNIEDVEEFEFKLCVAEAKVDLAMQKLGTLREMFNLASGRGERVSYLSVPRANVKSNVVFGRDTGYSPYYVDVPYDSVRDEITGLGTIDRGLLSTLSDGDVVFARYVNVDPAVTRAYYYSSATGTLLADPEGSSQDPFTGTDNTGSRCISFLVDDISSVNSRFGYMDKDGNGYFEVFFTARVSDVRSDPASVKVRFDVDRVNPDDEGLTVDYYGLAEVKEGEYRATMGFYGEDGWKWKSGYPTGMFYLRESSGAKLAEVGAGSRGELVPDPALAMEASKYAILEGSCDADSGIYEFVTESALPVTDGGRFYLVTKDGEIAGEFVTMPSSEVSGRYSYRMRALRFTPATHGNGTEYAWTEYSLLDFPLFYDKGVPDFSGSRPAMSWEVTGGDPGMDWQHAKACRCAPRGLYGAAPDPYVAAEVDFDPGDYRVDEEPLGRNQFLVPYAAKIGLEAGMRLYSCGILWKGLNAVSSVDDVRYVSHRDGSTVDGALVTMVNGIDKSSARQGVRLYDGYETVLVRVPGTPYYECGSYVVASLVPANPDSPAELRGFISCRAEGDGRTYSARVLRRETVEGHGLCIAVGEGELPDGVSAFAAAAYVVDCAAGSVAGFSSVKRTGERTFRGECGKHSGDVYTDAMYYAYDGKGGFAIISADLDNDVVAYEPGKAYGPGDKVYDPSAGRPFACIGKCVLSEGEYPSKSPYFREDPLTGTVSSYSKVYNRFIPYYGPVKAMEYGASVDYGAGTSVATLPLYITKVVENRLKYGWEHREFLNYGTAMDLTGRERNGSVDIFSSARSDGSGFESSLDAVTATLDSKAAWTISYPVIARGCSDYVEIDIDGGSVTATEDGDDWLVSVRSAGHGLVDGCTAVVKDMGGHAGYPALDGYCTVEVLDGDNLQFRTPRREPGLHGTFAVPLHLSETDPETHATESWDASMKYAGMYMLPATHVSGNGTTVEVVTGVPDPRGIRAGDGLGLVDRLFLREYPVTVVSVGGTGAVTVECSPSDAADILSAIGEGHAFHLQKSPVEGDYVLVGEKVYLVGKDAWTERERYDLGVPCTLFSRENLMDTSDTNPAFAMGDEIDVESITLSGEPGVALVRTRGMLPHFTAGNAPVIEGRTMVHVSGAVPACYNGWHTVVKVLSPKAFKVRVCYRGATPANAVGMNGGTIALREGRWYSFSVGGVDWDKVGNRVTYSLDNTVDTASGGDVTTSKEHGLKEGDLVVVGPKDSIAGVDAYSDPAVAAGIHCYRVRSVSGKFTATLENLDMTDVAVDANQCIARGVVVDHADDSIGSLRGEYTMELSTVGGNYRFRNGDIVVALSQENPCEVKAWRVVAGKEWEPVRRKRSLKVSVLDVESYLNGSFDGTDVESGEAYMKYATYSDVDVARRADAYVAGFRCVKNARFNVPALSDMDTTRNPAEEYSSAEDYSNVSPRHEMKPGFRGVPGMKYPLVEKIERLCYLRDASVIDYDFIGYLARFFGYDITPMGDDVAESPLYRTQRERELAIRETVRNLPQYYALGGTKAGLHMLFSTFGVISEALTLWTDARDPYGTMIPRDEVVERVESGDGGQWVPTPYIDIAVTNDARYPQFAVRRSDIERLKEQIRVFKPINVVFRDFLFRMEDTMEVVPRIAIAGIYGEAGAGVLSAVDDGQEAAVDYGDGKTGDCP